MSVPNENLQSPDDEFTFTVVGGEEQSKQLDSKHLPTHVKYLQDKLRKQKAQRKKLEEQQAREESLRYLLDQATVLNRESQTHNTQAAVLLSALQSLESDYRQSEQAKESLLEEIHVLKQQGGETHDRAKQSLSSLDAGKLQLDRLLDTARNVIGESAEASLQTAKSVKLAATTQQSAQQTIELVNSTLSEVETARRSYDGLKANAQEIVSGLVKAEQTSAALNRESRAACQASGEASNRADALFTRLTNELTVLEQHNQTQADQIAVTEKLNDTSRALIAKADVSQTKTAQQLQESAALVTQWQKDHEKSRHLVKQLKTALTGTLEKLAAYEKSYAVLEETSKHSETLLQQQQEALERSNALLLNTQQQAAEQSQQFTDAISNFSSGYETTQQQLQQSQRSMTQLLERNQLLEQENRMLQQRVNIMHAEPGQVEPEFNFSELLNTDFESEFNQDLKPEMKADFQPAASRAKKHRNFFGLALLFPLLLVVGAVINEAVTLDAGNLVTSVASGEAHSSSLQRIHYGTENRAAIFPGVIHDQPLWSS